MSSSAQKSLILIFFISALLAPLSTVHSAATTAPATQSADDDLLQFRQKTGIARVPLLRDAVKEADLPDDKRDQLLGVIDDADQKLHDLLAEYANSPHDSPEDWEDKRNQIARDFDAQTHKIASDRISQAAVSQAMQAMTVEMHMIEKKSLIDQMSTLNLSDDQKSKLKSITDQTANDLANASTTKPSTSIPDAERRQSILLTAHEHVRDVLTDDQKSQWTTYLLHHPEPQRGPYRTVLRPAPRPAP